MAPPQDIDAPVAIGSEELFVQHAAWVAKLLRRLGVQSLDLEDLVQDVFVVVHRNNGYRPGAAKPRTWLASICVRAASTYRRRRIRGALDDRAPDTVAGPDDVYRQALATERIQRVQRALDALDPRDSTVIVLRELEGFRCEEISRALGIPVGTVYSRLDAARRRFREKLGLPGDEPERALPPLQKQAAR